MVDPSQPKETSLAQFQQADISANVQRLSLWKRLTGAVNGFSDGFFTPGTPLPPVAPDGSPPRQFDYPLTWNINIPPRSGMNNSAITFAQLQGLADNWDILRAVIERRKEEMTKLSWGLTYKDEDTELTDADKKIAELLEYPDGEHDFATWLKAVLEDHFVGDCVSIEPLIDSQGKVQALYGVDGTTIALKIDERGRTPNPPNTAYQQIIKGVVYANFTKDELIYYPGNLRFSRVYGTSKVEQIFILANIALRRQTQQLYAFTEGTIPDALVTAAANWSPAQLREYQDYFDARMTGNLAKRSKLTWIPTGSAVVNAKADPLKQEFDEWMARVACYVMGVSPQGFVKEMNRATAGTAKDAARQEGLEPVMSFIANLMNRILRDCFKRPDLIFQWTEESQTDPKEEQEIDVAYIQNAVYSVDEVRQRKGLDKIGMDHAIWTTQGPVFVKDLVANPILPQQASPSQPEPDPTAKAVKALLKQKNGHLNKLPLTGLGQAKKKYADEVLKFFRLHAPKVTDEAWALISTKPSTKSAGDDNGDEADDVADSVQLDFFKDLPNHLTPLYVDMTTKAAAQALNQVNGVASVGVDIDTLLEQADAKAIAWAQDKAASMIGMKVVDGQLVPNPDAQWVIEDSTRGMVRDAVKQALDEGWSRDQLANALQDEDAVDAAFGAARAKLIAQTELSLAHNEGNRIGWRTSGAVAGRYSQLSDDHDEYDECDENAEAGPIPLDEPYPSGDDGPPFHPNCHCGEIAVLHGDE